MCGYSSGQSASHCVNLTIPRQAFDLFVDTFLGKYPGAVACLEKDRDALLAFYDFPAEHWIHLRTTNPIESTFATVRLRTRKTRGCGFLADVIDGVVFEDGVNKEAARSYTTHLTGKKGDRRSVKKGDEDGFFVRLPS